MKENEKKNNTENILNSPESTMNDIDCDEFIIFNI